MRSEACRCTGDRVREEWKEGRKEGVGGEEGGGDTSKGHSAWIAATSMHEPKATTKNSASTLGTCRPAGADEMTATIQPPIL